MSPIPPITLFPGVSKLSLNRYLLRFFFMLLVLAFVVSRLPWTRQAIGNIWSFPELQHQIIWKVGTDGRIADQAILFVVNSGLGGATNVLVRASIAETQVVSYQINSQELYELKTDGFERGVLLVWLDRFAPGASIQIVVKTAQPLSEDLVRLSAVSDQGSSEPRDSRTFTEQIDIYADSASGLFTRAVETVIESPSAGRLADWASTRPAIYGPVRMMYTDGFRDVTLAILVILAFVGLFFRPKHLGLAVLMSTWFMVWLFSGEWRIPAVIHLSTGLLPIAWFLLLISNKIDPYIGCVIFPVLCIILWIVLMIVCWHLHWPGHWLIGVLICLSIVVGRSRQR